MAPICLEPNYDDAELVGFTRPLLVNIIPWIKHETQNMTEPSFTQELQCIREAEHLQYIIVMIVWFQHWRQDQGWWPSLPACNFQVGALATGNIKMRVMSVVSQVDMSPGERQVFCVLTTLQYLAEVAQRAHHQGM